MLSFRGAGGRRPSPLPSATPEQRSSSDSHVSTLSCGETHLQLQPSPPAVQQQASAPSTAATPGNSTFRAVLADGAARATSALTNASARLPTPPRLPSPARLWSERALSHRGEPPQLQQQVRAGYTQLPSQPEEPSVRDASKKPSLLPMRRVSSRAAPSLSPVAGISEGEDGVSGGGSTPAPSDGAPSSSPPPPVVLMLASSAAYYDQQQSDGSLAIEVLRTGEPWRRVSVEYRTRDGDARAGEHFEAADGTLVFEPGETNQTITVALTPASGSWRPTLDFVVELHTPSGGASLPAHEDGRMCSVWLISTAQFPSNAVDHLSSRFELAKALTVWLWEDETVRNGTLKTVAIDLFSSLVFLWQLLVMEYFVNEVLHVLDEGGHARMQLVVLCGLSHAVPELILNRLRVLVCWFGVGGAARKRLRVNLLRRFMSYTEASRRRTGVAGCIEVLYRDAVEVRAALARPNKEHAHLQHSRFTTSFCRPFLVCPQYACRAAHRLWTMATRRWWIARAPPARCASSSCGRTGGRPSWPPSW